MTNAKEELESFLVEEFEGNVKVKCAKITKGYWSDEELVYSLKVNHTKEEYKEFLNSLNFDYDSGYGGQELFGTIWLEDGTWLTRGEYDGSEWWEHNKLPEISLELL